MPTLVLSDVTAMITEDIVSAIYDIALDMNNSEDLIPPEDYGLLLKLSDELRSRFSPDRATDNPRH